MKKYNFLKKLHKEEKLKLSEQSNEICNSYLEKADNCLKSARILFKNFLYENSVSEAYFCMYNSLLSLLFRIGIKSENHSASIVLFQKLFDKNDLFEVISKAKEERIDKQYYTESHQKSKANKETAKEFVSDAEEFLIQIKQIISELSLSEIQEKRKLFGALVSTSS